MQAVNGAAFATFVAAGQTCIMGARVLIHKSKYDEFVKKLSTKVMNECIDDILNLIRFNLFIYG